MITNCLQCGKPLSRRQISQAARCCSWACDRLRRPPAPPMVCPCCGRELTKTQRKSARAHGDSFCRDACRHAEPLTPTCERCSRPLTKTQIRGKYRFCSLSCAVQARTHRPPDATGATETHESAPGVSVEGVLYREGRIAYTKGLLNKVEVVYDGTRVYCTLAQWPTSAAGRRSQAPKPDVTLLMVEPVSAWRRAGREATIDE